MNDSILTSIKKLLGMTEDYTAFDTDIMIHINTIFLTLQQVGIGPPNGFTISDKSSTWSEFTDDILLEGVKTYVFLSVRLIFDPPNSGYLIDAMERQKKEILWRLKIHTEEVDQ